MVVKPLMEMDWNGVKTEIVVNINNLYWHTRFQNFYTCVEDLNYLKLPVHIRVNNPETEGSRHFFYVQSDPHKDEYYSSEGRLESATYHHDDYEKEPWKIYVLDREFLNRSQVVEHLFKNVEFGPKVFGPKITSS